MPNRYRWAVHTAAFVLFALAQAALAVVAIRLHLRRRALSPVSADPKDLSSLMLILPIAGVVWDNTIMALGARIGDGPLLVGLSWPRFIGHAVLTPAWIIAAIGFAQRATSPAGPRRASPTKRTLAWALFAFAVLAGVLRYVVFLEMAPVFDGGMFYYTNAGTFPGPPIGSITMLFVALIASTFVWRRARIPWMLLGSLFMLATQLIPRELVGFLVTNSGEVLMAASLVATEAALQRLERRPSVTRQGEQAIPARDLVASDAPA